MANKWYYKSYSKLPWPVLHSLVKIHVKTIKKIENCKNSLSVYSFTYCQSMQFMPLMTGSETDKKYIGSYIVRPWCFCTYWPINNKCLRHEWFKASKSKV